MTQLIIPEYHVSPLCSTESLREIAAVAEGEYLLLYTKPSELILGMNAVRRMMSVASDTLADMVYADHYDRAEDGQLSPHPLIDCQAGALRDDFDFGGLILYRTSSFIQAVEAMDVAREWGALYDLRLRMGNIIHINCHIPVFLRDDICFSLNFF